MRLRYDKATKDMDIARQAYESANQDMNKTAKDIEKVGPILKIWLNVSLITWIFPFVQLRLDAEKKAMTAQDAAAQYRQCVGEWKFIECTGMPMHSLSQIVENQNRRMQQRRNILRKPSQIF